ncbi:MAG: hypothetical protein IPL60_11520 [Ardenticatenia bacterium]|nr:hypothetical protein [Ardenticatenia bacterium]
MLRRCPGDVTPGAEVVASYSGLTGYMLGQNDPVFGGYAYYAPYLIGDWADLSSWVYIQNAGLECSSVEIWFRRQDDCLRDRICDILQLAPGETYAYDAADCIGPGWQGSAWIRGSEPLAVVVDTAGRDILTSYSSVPVELNFGPGGPPSFKSGSRVAYGPLSWRVPGLGRLGAGDEPEPGLRRQGQGVLHGPRRGHRRRGGGLDLPRGSQTFFLPVLANLPGNWTGSVRVESQGYFKPGSPPVDPADIQAVMVLLKYSDPARTETVEAVAYNLLPEVEAFDWQVGPPRECCRCPGPGCVGGHRHPLLQQGPLLQRSDQRAGGAEPGGPSGLHRLRHLRLRPERASRLRMREAEQPTGDLPQPGPARHPAPRLQGLRRGQRRLLGNMNPPAVGGRPMPWAWVW